MNLPRCGSGECASQVDYYIRGLTHSQTLQYQRELYGCYRETVAHSCYLKKIYFGKLCYLRHSFEAQIIYAKLCHSLHEHN